MDNKKEFFHNRRNLVKAAAKIALVSVVVMIPLLEIMPATFIGKNLSDNNSITTQKENVLDQYNIIWNSPSKNSSESMPLGGFDIGCNVWVENEDILFYMQRSGSLDENGEYLKLGRIRVNMTPNPFAGYSSFRQELKVKEGFIEIEASKNFNGSTLNAKVKLWVDILSPVIHLDVKSNQPVEVKAAYESWRFKEKELPDSGGRYRWGCFSLEGYPGKVIKRKDEIAYSDQGVLFYHRNSDDKLIPNVLIKQQSLEASANEIVDDIKDRTFGGILYGKGFEPAGTGEGTYLSTPFRSWIIKTKKPQKDHELLVVTHIEQAKTIDDWKKKLNARTDQASRNKTAFKSTVDWWSKYWERSWIIIPRQANLSDSVWQMARNYQLFRYQLGCNVSGEYPSKFNGGNLTFDPVLVNKNHSFDPDWRSWGGDLFTAQNQRLLHWPMLKSGDFDLILPQFELYRKALPGATALVKTHFGHEGSVFCEYISAPGVAFGGGWGWQNDTKHRNRGEEVPFGDPRINGLAGYGKIVEKGVMANSSVAYHWESQLENAYMMLEYHRFTGKDISRYMPFIKSAVLFFDKHYQLRQKMRNGKGLDDNGKLVIYPSTSCESYRGAKNPSDIIAGLRACLKGLSVLDGKFISASEKKYFNEFLERVPDFPFDKMGESPILKPAHEWLVESNQELPQFYPLFPFNQFKIGDKEIEIFKNTYRLAPDSRKGKIMSWHQDGIFFARMGMAKEAAEYNTKKLQDSERRFPTFWGPGHDWAPDHNWGGSGMIGLQEMVMQTVGDKILILPAWPKDWDVSFKLHAPQNTTVEVEFVKGEFKKINVIPASRKKDVVLPVPSRV